LDANTSDPDILQLAHAATNGVSILELQLQFPALSRRSLQRKLVAAIAAGALIAKGVGRATRYFAATKASTSAHVIASDHNTAEINAFPSFITISSDSQDILAYVDQPLPARAPVGYQRELLESYQPNVTCYLPESMRLQLRNIGATGSEARPAGTYGRAILNRLLIDLSWASSQLEGNTYTRLDTRELIEHGRVAKGRAASETQMILNHKAAIELLVDSTEALAFNRFTLMNLHSALAENLLPNPADEGRLRSHLVEISGSVYRPLAVPAQINDQFDLMLEKVSQITDPFEQSFFVMVHLPYLQAFSDINKRTSRLAANLPLIRANLCPLTFLDVPQAAYSRAILGVYEMARIELLRDVYRWAYIRSAQEYLAIKKDLAEPDPLRLSYRGLIKKAIFDILTQPDTEPMTLVHQYGTGLSVSDRQNVEALIIDELRRLHDGVLARYGLRPAQLAIWRARRFGS
jgi:Fic family protein